MEKHSYCTLGDIFPDFKRFIEEQKMGEKRKSDKKDMKKPMKKEKHKDEKQDMAMLRKSVKKDCMK